MDVTSKVHKGKKEPDMTDKAIGLENKEDLLIFEISDDVLETAAGTRNEKAVNFTLGACSGLSVCPG
jgi:hypothetical protein